MIQDFVEKVLRNFAEFFRGLDFSKKISLIGTALMVIAAVVSMLMWATKTRFAVLYTDLNREDAKQIAVLLEEKKIPYQTSKDGKTVSIPEENVERWRLELATMGVTFSGTVGYEVFDKQAFGTTSFVQKVNRQRALEGELTKTIRYISGVKRSRVHLSIPENSPFVSEKKPPGASVVLELDNGVVLTAQEVRGIGNLVASSVEEMRPENVVILDHRGKQLSENRNDPLAAQTANQMALESQINRDYEEKIEQILKKVVGEGKVVAKVNVQLDFTKQDSTETSYDNENAAVLSEVKNSQKINGSRPSPQGIPGARSNLPGELPQPGIPETTNAVDKELTTKNFNVPSKVTRSQRPSAVIKSISAAVMVDGKRVAMLNENGEIILDKAGKTATRYEQWNENDLASFQAIVTSALNINGKRGDVITIKNMEFVQEDLSGAEEIMKERERQEFIKNIVKYMSIGLTISLFFFLVVRPFIQWVTDNTIESVEDFLPKTLEELEKIQAGQKLPGLEDALPQIEEKLNPEKIEGNMLREKIISLVENNPAKAAQVVHEMIHSGGAKQIA